ncbi:hypothetical protein [Amycolatopsis anabasis]|nr:hypothetical protein [Amycolatopsis anabasis]
MATNSSTTSTVLLAWMIGPLPDHPELFRTCREAYADSGTCC